MIYIYNYIYNYLYVYIFINTYIYIYIADSAALATDSLSQASNVEGTPGPTMSMCPPEHPPNLLWLPRRTKSRNPMGLPKPPAWWPA